MEKIGIGLKLGVAGMARGALSVSSNGRSLVRDIDPRRGLHVALPIHFGGGFGFTVEPYVSRSSLEHGVRDAEGTIVGSEATSLTAWGAYLGLALNLQVATPVYLGVGLGVKGAYIATDGFDYALDAYGRLPLSVTYYVVDQCAFVAELGLGYGLSLFADRPRLRFDPLTGIPRNVPESPQIGTAFAWDFSFGVRLP